MCAVLGFEGGLGARLHASAPRMCKGTGLRKPVTMRSDAGIDYIDSSDAMYEVRLRNTASAAVSRGRWVG